MTQASEPEAGTSLSVSREVRRSLAMISPRERRTSLGGRGAPDGDVPAGPAGVLMLGIVGVIASSAAQGVALPETI